MIDGYVENMLTDEKRKNKRRQKGPFHHYRIETEFSEKKSHQKLPKI